MPAERGTRVSAGPATCSASMLSSHPQLQLCEHGLATLQLVSASVLQETSSPQSLPAFQTPGADTTTRRSSFSPSQQACEVIAPTSAVSTAIRQQFCRVEVISPLPAPQPIPKLQSQTGRWDSWPSLLQAKLRWKAEVSMFAA